MGAVSNVTVLSDSYTVNRVLSKRAAPEFAKSIVFMPLIYVEDLPENMGTAVKAFRREGSMTASATLAEATAGALGTVRSDTVVSATAAKAVRADGISYESQKFGMSNLNSYVQSQARSIGRIVDNQGLALFPSVTNQVDCAGALTMEKLDDAQLLILQSAVPDADKQLVFVGSSKAYRNLKTDIRTSSGSAFTSERFLSIFDGAPKANGFYGNLPGMDLYHTPSGLTAVSAQSSQCLFHPDWAFAGMFDKQINVLTNEIGVGGLYTELVSYFFWAQVLWNDTAAVEVLSTT
jgi:hypothetical protein